MPHSGKKFSPYYDEIIIQTEKHATNVSDEIDMILDDIRKCIRGVNPRDEWMSHIFLHDAT